MEQQEKSLRGISGRGGRGLGLAFGNHLWKSEEIGEKGFTQDCDIFDLPFRGPFFIMDFISYEAHCMTPVLKCRGDPPFIGDPVDPVIESAKASELGLAVTVEVPHEMKKPKLYRSPKTPSCRIPSLAIQIVHTIKKSLGNLGGSVGGGRMVELPMDECRSRYKESP